MKKITEKEYIKGIEEYRKMEWFTEFNHSYGEKEHEIVFRTRYMTGDAYTGYDTLHEEEATFVKKKKGKKYLYYANYFHWQWEGY